jgi:two-component system cell cycle sensor histidine kinase/response regulator CckA
MSDTDLLHKLTLAVDQSPAAIFITDTSGTIEYVNARFTESTGYSREEAVGANPRILQSGLTPRETYHALWSCIRAGGIWKAEIQNRRKNGELYWDAVTISPIRDAGGTVTHFLAIQQDITERKREQEALIASERRLRTLFETVKLVVLVLDAEGKLEYLNPFALQLTGYARDEVIGGRWIDRFVPEEERAGMTDIFQELLHYGDHTHYHNAILTRSGARRMIAWHNTVVRDERGEPTGTLSVGEDITEHEKLEEQYRQAQKMEAVGQLAGGVAHDFNNLLTVILSYASMLHDSLPPDDQRRQDVEPILKAGEAAAGLTRQLLAFSRQQVIHPRPIQVETVVAQAEKLLRRVIGDDVTLHTALHPEPATVVIDPGQLEQVIMNLAVNARDAMPRGGSLSIETSRVELDEDYARTHWPATAGRFVLLAVTDTGTGMNDATRARIFEPFFTTKEVGRGTGLGLATVYGIVKQSGGFIWVYSEPGQGSTFKIYLPLVDRPSEPLSPHPPAHEIPRGSETVLLTEDAAAVRAAARQILERAGYTVIEATNGRAAIDLAAKRAGPIDLLLTDVVMPELSGKQLADRFKLIRPGARVLFMSGYTDDAIVRHGVLEPGIAYLQKPFTPETLARKVREVLDAPPPP